MPETLSQNYKTVSFHDLSKWYYDWILIFLGVGNRRRRDMWSEGEGYDGRGGNGLSRTFSTL